MSQPPARFSTINIVLICWGDAEYPAASYLASVYTRTGVTYKITDINSSRKPYISLTQLRVTPNVRVSLFTTAPVIAIPYNAVVLHGTAHG